MKKKKDVLFLCQFFYPEHVSSATLPYDTAVKLSENGYTVDVVCGYPKEYVNKDDIPKKECINNINIKRLKYLQLKRSSTIGRLINYFSFIFRVFLCLFTFHNYKSIIVYSNPPILPYIAYLAKKFFKSKLVFVSYDLYPEIAITTNAISETGITAKMMKYINKKVFPQLNAVVALASEMKSFIVKNRDIDSFNVNVIPNWYEDEIIDKSYGISVDNKFYNEYHDKIIVSYLGNMGTCQDMRTIIEVAVQLKENPNIKFLLAGHGNKVSYLKDIIENENLSNVDLFDFLIGKDYQDALQASTFAVVSLEAGLNGLCVPSKTYAYMMAGIPIIAIMNNESDIATDIIENEAGIVCNNKDSSTIIEFLLSNDTIANYNKMSDNIRKVFLSKYEKNVCLEQYLKLWKELI